jgi:hypothetical protein
MSFLLSPLLVAPSAMPNHALQPTTGRSDVQLFMNFNTKIRSKVRWRR